jgi:ubiquitin conjugation factor E4 B
VPDEFPDPIMSTIMLNPVRLPTSGDVMDRDVISRVLPSDKQDSFNRQFLSEDMLEDEAELKICMQEFRATRRTRSQSKHKGGGGAGRSGS